MTLDEAWSAAEKALLAHMRAHHGGSPYLAVTEDLYGWVVATGSHGTNDSGGCSRGAEGDTPAEALVALAARLSEPT